MDDILKSSRHKHIIGRFAEWLVLYWLSRDGFECTWIDHTGIDLLANNCRTGKLMGISVKSRCREKGREHDSLSCRVKDFRKIHAACDAFRCDPYFAFVIDTGNKIAMFLVSEDHFKAISKTGKSVIGWGMSTKHLAAYQNDPEIMWVEFSVSEHRWWKAPRIAEQKRRK